MKRYVLLVAMVLSCLSYGVVTYKCDKDYVVYQMNCSEMSLVKCILNGDLLAKYVVYRLRGLDNFWVRRDYIINVPAVLMILANDKKFLDIIRYYPIFKEIFPELFSDDINAVREKFEIRKRDICLEGQNQKLFAYLKERYALWRMKNPVREPISHPDSNWLYYSPDEILDDEVDWANIKPVKPELNIIDEDLDFTVIVKR